MEQQDLIKKIGEILNRLKIPYIITGGIAVVIWGRPRFTADIDVVIELLPEKLNKLAKELLAIDKDVYINEEAMRDALERHGEFNFIHPSTALKVDFWILKKDIYSREQIKRRVSKKIGDKNIYFISPEDLILSKLLWYQKTQSTRQLEDIESIFKFQKKLDLDYLKKWSGIQSTHEILRNFHKVKNGRT
ncbi:MAG: nucleotidyltransferase [Candidatus Yanofskybacteria bacterium]|nr:nucleotidyltransferase [Candidatus Yanofskybacteria bacterium]